MNLVLWVSLILVLIVFLEWFHRHPRINIREDPSYLVSPSYGTVLHADPIKGHIAIFLSIGDPHIQYAPTSGRVLHQEYKTGTFVPAYWFKKSQYNERLETIIHDQWNRGTVKVVQIAGQIARRIVSFVKPHDYLRQGDELGMIKLGSRVDLYYDPKYWRRILVKEGDKVYGPYTKLVS